jgi:hypothetical protein
MDQLASRPGVPMLTFPTPSDGGSLLFSTCFQEEREDRGLGRLEEGFMMLNLRSTETELV